MLDSDMDTWIFVRKGSARIDTMISLQVFYEGNVQGVGFRWSVRHVAKGFDVTGWVRNLPDGRVELQANGRGRRSARFPRWRSRKASCTG